MSKVITSGICTVAKSNSSHGINLIRVFAFVITGFLLFGPAYAFKVIDDDGFEVVFEKPFARIISLYPAHTENIFSLGAERQLIGIGRSDNYPDSVHQLQRFSYHDNTEKFISASPDLILIRPMISRSQPELIKKLRQSGITIVSLQPTSIAKMFDYWRALGLLTGRQVQADRMVESFTGAVDEIRKALPEDPDAIPDVYFESIHAKMKTFAPTAIASFVLTSAGGRNIAGDAVGRNNSNIAPYGKERLLSHAGDIDVFLSQVGRMNRVTVKDIYNEPGFSLIKAIRDGSVYLVEEELVSRPTMRLIIGIQKIHSLLHPAADR